MGILSLGKKVGKVAVAPIYYPTKWTMKVAKSAWNAIDVKDTIKDSVSSAIDGTKGLVMETLKTAKEVYDGKESQPLNENDSRSTNEGIKGIATSTLGLVKKAIWDKDSGLLNFKEYNPFNLRELGRRITRIAYSTAEIPFVKLPGLISPTIANLSKQTLRNLTRVVPGIVTGNPYATKKPLPNNNQTQAPTPAPAPTNNNISNLQEPAEPQAKAT